MAIETAIISALIFIALVKYSQHTTELSIKRRWKLVNFIQEVKKDSDYSKEFKTMLDNMFLDSTKKNLVPQLFFFMVYMYFFKKDTYKEIGKDFNTKILKSEKEHKAYKTAMNIMFEVNFLSSPHWYLIVVLLAMIMFIFSKITKTLQSTNFEQTVYTGLYPRKFA